MTPEVETRIRDAFATLADVVVEALRTEARVAGGPERLLTIREAQEALGGLSRSALYGLINRGTLRSVKPNRRRYVPASAIAEIAKGDS